MSASEIQQWVTLAAHDAETARLLTSQNGYPEIIMYHMHQAIEKYLKALILKAELPIRRTHHLDLLLSELIGTQPELAAIKDTVLLLQL